MRRSLTLSALAVCALALAAPAIAAPATEVPNPLGTAQKAPPAKPGVNLAKPAAPAASSTAVFPKAVDPKYAKMSEGKARMQTCLDQYKANGDAGNGGLKWIEKGGGYYSQCNKRLKG